MAEPPSSPPSEGASTEDALQWYKLQYEQLEQELIEFRESSRELEQELEKDIEGAEKRERDLQEKAESLNFEVDEWKRKYRESKSEASAAQNALEKEITTLRDSNRTLQLRLRDTEVANDDFERQARNTTSSLEDLESKYNVAIERGVMLEEEIRMGEQERETLRIDSQRLREELSDVKIEVEVLQEKVRKQESRHLSMISTDISVAESSTFDKNIENSPQSTASSPLISTPPDTAELPPSKDPIQDPPSPPMSDASASLSKPRSSLLKTPASTQRKTRLPSADNSTTPKPRTSIFSSSTSKRPVARVPAATPANRSTAPRSTSHKLPASNSLTHIRSLTAQVQRLEARVHSARSRLPARVSTPPRVSPATSVNGMGGVPSTVTIRARKRTTGSTSSSVVGDDATPTNTAQSRRATQSGSKHIPRLSTSGVSRLSFGPIPNRGPGGGDSEASISRPSSRASISSGIARPVSRTEMHPPPRPTSRASLSGARTPLGRPRSSLGGSVHGHSASVGRFEPDEVDDELRTPSRRGSLYSKFEGDTAAAASRIPAPNRRQSAGRRASSGIGFRAPTPLEDLDETY